MIRAHLERAYFMNRGLADVVVALCSFAPKVAGPPRLINELVCRPEDYMRVAHGRVHLPDWTDGEFGLLSELGGDGQGPEPVVPADALPEGTVGLVQDNGYVRMLGEEKWEN